MEEHMRMIFGGTKYEAVTDLNYNESEYYRWLSDTLAKFPNLMVLNFQQLMQFLDEKFGFKCESF